MAKNEKSQAEIYREERKKRLAKSAKKNAKKSISSNSAKIAGRIITIIICLAIVAGIGSVIFIHSGIKERSTIALTVGDDEVSQAEYGYYYYQVYSTLYSYASYGYISLDTSSALSSQEYDNTMGEIEDFPEDETPTWADYIEYSAQSQIAYVYECKQRAIEKGLELDEEDEDYIADEVAEVEDSASENNYSASAYLKRSYGNGMNVGVFEDILTVQRYANAYQEYMTDKYADKVTDEDIEEEYENNIDTYGTVSVKYVTLAATTDTDDDGNSTVNADSLALMKKAANKIGKATSVKEFQSLVNKVKKSNDAYSGISITDTDDETCENVTALASSDTDFSSWATSSKTAVGSTYVYGDDSQYIVFVMVDPLHHAPDKDTFTSRHILINFVEDEEETTDEDTTEETTAAEDTDETTAETTEAETTEAPKEEVEIPELDMSKADDVVVDNRVTADNAQNKEGYLKIQNVLQEYLDGEHTEEAFAALAEKYSEDTGSNEDGGLYEDTEEGNFVAPYEDWCLADGRKEGDVGIVEYSDEDNYSGYHLIYFISRGVTTWKDTIRDAIAEDEYSEKSEKIAEKASCENINDKATAKVVSYFDKLIKQSASSSSSSSY